MPPGPCLGVRRTTAASAERRWARGASGRGVGGRGDAGAVPELWIATRFGDCMHGVRLPVRSAGRRAPWEEQNWEVVMRQDRAYYEMQEPEGMDFPEQTSSRRVLLTGDHIRIGRRSTSKGIDAEIDLSGALEDTGVSHRHAVLMRQPEGNWALVDQESTNGTYLNADEEPIPANNPDAAVGRRPDSRRGLDDSDHGAPRAGGRGATRGGEPAVEGHAERGPRPPTVGDRPARTAPSRGVGGRGPDRRAKTPRRARAAGAPGRGAYLGRRPRMGALGRGGAQDGSQGTARLHRGACAGSSRTRR